MINISVSEQGMPRLDPEHGRIGNALAIARAELVCACESMAAGEATSIDDVKRAARFAMRAVERLATVLHTHESKE